jgi:hypothetical protein
METLQRIKEHAAAIIAKGAPFTKEELAVLKLATPSRKAFNAGKRTTKNHNNNW